MRTWCAPLVCAVLAAQGPTWVGDPEDLARLEAPLEAALEATEAFGPWPRAAWRVQVHPDAASFERATGAPPQRAASWVGTTLHLRSWEQLRRRELGSLLRHELVHRRLAGARLRRWEEEARCLWAETHVRPPAAWPAAPETRLQARLDLALARGTTESQAWAYRWLRAWLEGRPTPEPPATRGPEPDGWEPVAPVEAPPSPSPAPEGDRVRVCWPEARMPARLVVNGRELVPQGGRSYTFEGPVRFGPECPVRELEGRVEARWSEKGWTLTWETSPQVWVAAAVAGELGAGPAEAKRALAAVLFRWLEGHRDQHGEGTLCPLTHCAVVRGQPRTDDLRAAATAPKLDLDSRWAFFTGSTGGHPLSPREVWGRGPAVVGKAAPPGPEDRWATWERVLTAEQVQRLKREVRPGVLPGQRGMKLGVSGPYPVENLRLAAGRAFGWTVWPSNVCEGQLQPDGSLRLKGHGWGHNVGLCLVSAVAWAQAGWSAEAILEATFVRLE